MTKAAKSYIILNAVREHFRDHFARKVYAEYLKERGKEDIAEFIVANLDNEAAIDWPFEAPVHIEGASWITCGGLISGVTLSWKDWLTYKTDIMEAPYVVLHGVQLKDDPYIFRSEIDDGQAQIGAFRDAEHVKTSALTNTLDYEVFNMSIFEYNLVFKGRKQDYKSTELKTREQLVDICVSLNLLFPSNTCCPLAFVFPGYIRLNRQLKGTDGSTRNS